jgi:NitT/TauT family transport system substrate-binding protein
MIPLGCAPSARPTASPAFSGEPVRVKEKVRIGVLPIASASGNWVAIAKGYFEQEGIEPEVTVFQTAGEMVAPLAAGQLDVGAGAPGVGLHQALLRGIDIKIVADQATLVPGHHYQAIVVRRDLYETGQVTGPADMKGRKYAVPSTIGITVEVMLNQYMQRAGLNARDVDMVAMGFPDIFPALANKAIDTGLLIEPFLTLALESGDVVVLEHGDNVYPNQQVAVVLYAGEFAKKTDLATRYMVAYLRGVRDYNDAFVKNDPAKRAEVVDILAESTPVKQKPLYDRMAYPGLSPNGTVNLATLKADQDYYIEAKLQERPADLDRAVDQSFAEAAVRRLGPY